MKKLLKSTMLLVLLSSVFSVNAEINDFTKKSALPDHYLGSFNVSADLQEGKSEFNNKTVCLEGNNQLINGEVVGVVNKTDKNIYLVKTSNGLKHFEDVKSHNIGDIITKKEQKKFC